MTMKGNRAPESGETSCGIRSRKTESASNTRPFTSKWQVTASTPASQAEYARAGNGKGREAKRETQVAEARALFLDIARDFEEHSRHLLIGAGKAKGISETNAMAAVKQLVEGGELSERRGERGKY